MMGVIWSSRSGEAFLISKEVFQHFISNLYAEVVWVVVWAENLHEDLWEPFISVEFHLITFRLDEASANQPKTLMLNWEVILRINRW